MKEIVGLFSVDGPRVLTKYAFWDTYEAQTQVRRRVWLPCLGYQTRIRENMRNALLNYIERQILKSI